MSIAPTVVPVANLVDWLADRQVLKPQWRSKLRALQLKVEEAGEQLTPELRAVLHKQISYRTAKQVQDSLLAAPEKNALGFITGPTLAWQKLVRGYEKEMLQIGEAAILLVRNCQFEIPFLKTLIGKQQKQLLDLDNKDSDFSKSAAAALKLYQQECSNLGIQGLDVEKELGDLVAGLAEYFYKAVQKLQRPSILQAIEWYGQCMKSMSDDHSKSVLSCTAEVCLPLLLQAAQAEVKKPLQSGRKSANIAVVSKELEVGQQCNDLDLGLNTPNIDWDIDSGLTADLQPGGDSVTDSKPQETTETPDTVERLQYDSKFRAAVMLELTELLAFIEMRRQECSTSAYALLSATSRETVQQMDLSALTKLDEDLRECLEALSSEKIKVLLALQSSPSCLRRTAAALQRQADQESKFFRLQREVEGKRQQVQRNLVGNSQSLAILLEMTSELRGFEEQQLTTLFKGRPIAIGWDIN